SRHQPHLDIRQCGDPRNIASGPAERFDGKSRPCEEGLGLLLEASLGGNCKFERAHAALPRRSTRRPAPMAFASLEPPLSRVIRRSYRPPETTGRSKEGSSAS